MLDEGQRLRFARHLLLSEIGDTEQAALCDAQLAFTPDTDEGVRRVATEYLRRAGVEVLEGTSVPAQGAIQAVPGASSTRVRDIAGAPELETAAQALLGALEAVEQIKRITGAGVPAAHPPNLTLSREEP